MDDDRRLAKALDALRTLAGCMPDCIWVYGAYGELWKDSEPDTDEYEVVQLQLLLREIDL